MCGETDKTEKEIKSARELFSGWNETMILSCLSGSMGRVLVSESGKSAAALIADFAFFAGEADASLLLQSPTARSGDFAILIPGGADWETLIEKTFGASVRRVTRYSTKKETRFDRNKLISLAKNVPEGYTLCMIDDALFDKAGRDGWSCDLVAQFSSAAEYKAHGIGVCAVTENGEIASGASSYTWYPGGIEVEIDTSPAHRGQGLAKACGARLVLECLDRGLYPGWDAHNKASLKIAGYLGYEADCEYTAYEKR